MGIRGKLERKERAYVDLHFLMILMIDVVKYYNVD